MVVEAKFESDQGLEGIVRIAEINIENEDGKKEYALEKEVWNKLSDKEYNTNTDEWEKECKLDISRIVGCNIEDVTVY